MRKLTHPLIDDIEVLNNLVRSRGKRPKAIQSRLPDIRTRYTIYRQHCGDPWLVPEDATFQPIREVLHSLYKAPPHVLAFLSSLRHSVDGACPVCGRDALGTLDHYLPKVSYAEFSFYSLNLIPACDRCNNVRNDLARGANAGERALHPYFDEFATSRVMTVEFQPDWRAPLISPIPFNVQGHPRTIVQWHIDNVIRRAGIEPYLINLWGSLVRNARLFFPDISSRNSMKGALDQLMEIESLQGKSPNTWKSCFYHGLSTCDDALDYIASLT